MHAWSLQVRSLCMHAQQPVLAVPTGLAAFPIARLPSYQPRSHNQSDNYTAVLVPRAAVCHNPVLLNGDARLRSSALLALTKLMIVDAGFCEAKVYKGKMSNLELLFALLQSRCDSSIGCPTGCEPCHRQQAAMACWPSIFAQAAS